MIALKACARCHGDMVREDLVGGVELVCIQCGYRVDGVAPRPAGRAIAFPKRTAAA